MGERGLHWGMLVTAAVFHVEITPYVASADAWLENHKFTALWMLSVVRSVNLLARKCFKCATGSTGSTCMNKEAHISTFVDVYDACATSRICI
jgi:hypothetical protein